MNEHNLENALIRIIGAARLFEREIVAHDLRDMAAFMRERPPPGWTPAEINRSIELLEGLAGRVAAGDLPEQQATPLTTVPDALDLLRAR